MKSEAPATVASAIPVTVGEAVVVQPPKIPLAAKVAGTAFLAVLVPIYLHTYGPANFLWFCDAALMLTVAGMWWESSLLISMCSVGIPPTRSILKKRQPRAPLPATVSGFSALC